MYYTLHQIRLKWAGFIKKADVLINANKCILNDIFCGGFILRDQKRSAHGFGLVRIHQGFQPVHVPAFQELNGFLDRFAGQIVCFIHEYLQDLFDHSYKLYTMICQKVGILLYLYNSQRSPGKNSNKDLSLRTSVP